ncbi:hypothetical protein SAMN05192583_0089 [Sphingomonas gellani]|uniref:Uncharacterized protein n=1 Tax=Sphingomonas gellani TaxID=1166340 RepID=A0A1H7Y6Z0_9SPHN|nr:hypothetical protein [Sphingomonas gellani]SEM40949.1 hypothetical protein SAMN05192583_0089 [Sphingomonas gellani]
MPTTKVRHLVNISRITRLTYSWLIQHACPAVIEREVRNQLAPLRLRLLDHGRSTLRDHLRRDPQHLQNVYLTWDGQSEMAAATYVFGDKTTALLFRLSLP